MENIKILKVRKTAIIPKKATNGSAGYDLFDWFDHNVQI